MAGRVRYSDVSGEKAGILTELLRNATLAWRLLRDPRVALTTKLIIPALAGIYVLSPVDLLPDLFPLLGQMDDLAVLALAIRLFIEFSPPQVVQEHLAAIIGGKPGRDGETVEGEYRVVD